MPISLDNEFALHARALGIASQRLGLLADNVANADTPGFLARDIDFNTAMQNADASAGTLQTTHATHISLQAGGSRAEVLYRVPEQPSMDGNTVDSEKETGAVAETAVRYEATLTFLNAKIRGLRLAITGGR
jgi:flagellar basal-body rod protein FlgB